ncbi:MAG TPA: hypothetical protein VK667_13165, partial [Ktedonobacteraceae bacterium]|nr:hypothetical protein [Ktedonobacteraceae bacterium]
MQTTTRKGLPLPAANDQGSTSTTTGRGTSTSGVVRDSVNTISTIADYFTDYDKDEIIQGRWEFSSPFVTDKGLGQLFANNTGAARVVGDVVMLDPANDSTVILPNAVGVSAAKIGVVAENIANGAVGRIAWSGFIRVKVAGGFLRGQYLQTQNASVIAAGSTYASPGTFAIA